MSFTKRKTARKTSHESLHVDIEWHMTFSNLDFGKRVMSLIELEQTVQLHLEVMQRDCINDLLKQLHTETEYLDYRYTSAAWMCTVANRLPNRLPSEIRALVVTSALDLMDRVMKWHSLEIILKHSKDIKAACLDLAIKMHLNDTLVVPSDLYEDNNEEAMLACEKEIVVQTKGKIFPYAIDKTISAICNYLLLKYSICTRTLWDTTCAELLIKKATSIFSGCFYRSTGCFCIWKIIVTACILSLHKYASRQHRDSLSIVESRLIQILQGIGMVITEEGLRGLKDEMDRGVCLFFN